MNTIENLIGGQLIGGAKARQRRLFFRACRLRQAGLTVRDACRKVDRTESWYYKMAADVKIAYSLTA